MPAAARSLSSWPTSAVWSSPASAQSADPRRSTSHPHPHGSAGDSCCQERTRALAATDLSGDRFTIITGGPGGGKTSLVDELRRRGFAGMQEAGRAIIGDQTLIGGAARHPRAAAPSRPGAAPRGGG